MKKLRAFISRSRSQRKQSFKTTGQAESYAKDQNQQMDHHQPKTLSQVLSIRAKLSPDTPLISYATTDGFVEYTAKQLYRLVLQARREYSREMPARNNSEKQVVIGLLGPASLDFVIAMYALWSLGHAIVLLSPRLAVEAYVHLLKEVGATAVVFHTSFAKTMNEVREALPELKTYNLVTEEQYRNQADDHVEIHEQSLTVNPDEQHESTAVFIHSSGSTGLPKPNALSHKALVGAAGKNVNLEAFCCVPFFHAFGLNSLNRAVFSGKRISLYNADLPMTHTYLIQILKSKRPGVMFCVPYTLKLLAETQEGLDALKICELVWFAGSACPDDLGDKLTQEGIKLVSDYGLSECGPLMSTMRPDNDKAWNYLRPYPHVLPYLKFEERSPDLFELVCASGMSWMKMDNEKDYATNDLFVKHPEIENAYKFVARQDDTLVLSNGEKANPVDLEGKVRQHPLVSEAIGFGANKTELGLVVIKSSSAEDLEKEEMLDQVWPSVKDGQRDMPAHGKISRAMILVFPHDTELPRTLKGTVIRQQFYRKFDKEIEAAYEEKEGEDITHFDERGLRQLIRKELLEMLEVEDKDLQDDADFFRFGVDSLQSTRLRRALQRRVDLKGAQLPLNIVYEHPSVEQLSNHIYKMISGGQGEATEQPQDVEYFLDKFGTFSRIKSHTGTRNVVLTGSTGSLGAHILAQLLQMPDVQKIYCLVRNTSKQDARQRVEEALKSRRLNDGLSDLEREKIIALSADLSDGSLGLDTTTYLSVSTNLTSVIHAAWPVNFNLRLSSFEPDIRGTRNLIDLGLATRRSTPPTFAFCSSISTMLDSQDTTIREDRSSETTTISMGYAQSKVVAENLCIKASEQAKLKSYILRIGQITGDTKHGIWNCQESIPMILQTAKTVGALPSLDNDEYRWLPVDVTASAILDITLSGSASAGTIFNLVNPTTFNFTTDLLPKLSKAGLEFDKVPAEEWLDRLRNSDPDASVNPPIKLLSFFELVYGKSRASPSSSSSSPQPSPTDPENTEPPTTKTATAAQGLESNHDWITHNTSTYSDTFRRGWTLDQAFVDKMLEYLQGQCWKNDKKNGGTNSRRSSGPE